MCGIKSCTLNGPEVIAEKYGINLTIVTSKFERLGHRLNDRQDDDDGHFYLRRATPADTGQDRSRKVLCTG